MLRAASVCEAAGASEAVGAAEAPGAPFRSAVRRFLAAVPHPHPSEEERLSVCLHFSSQLKLHGGGF